MLDTTQDIIGRLLGGEDSFTEFKEAQFRGSGIVSPHPEDVAGEMVAFANPEGGTIFFGVDDGGLVKGIPTEWLRKTEEWAVNIATNNCVPPVRPIVRSVALPDQSGE